jgi:hypothetical protein
VSHFEFAEFVRLPNLRLVGEPELAWFRPIASYVFNDAAIACG